MIIPFQKLPNIQRETIIVIVLTPIDLEKPLPLVLTKVLDELHTTEHVLPSKRDIAFTNDASCYLLFTVCIISWSPVACFKSFTLPY